MYSCIKCFVGLLIDVAVSTSAFSGLEHVESLSIYSIYNFGLCAFFLKYCSHPSEPLPELSTDLVMPLAPL